MIYLFIKSIDLIKCSGCPQLTIQTFLKNKSLYELCDSFVLPPTRPNLSYKKWHFKISLKNLIALKSVFIPQSWLLEWFVLGKGSGSMKVILSPSHFNEP